MDYYSEALELIISKIYNKQNIVINIFSDDIEWVKKNFISNHLTQFISDYIFSSIQDLYFMSKCIHFITANSSLSWWGAFLGDINFREENQRIVCTPLKWFNDREMLPDFIPNHWNLIRNI